MKKTIATLALSALIGAPAFAAGAPPAKRPTEAQKEKSDKAHEGADARAAAADAKRAHDLYVAAAKNDAAAMQAQKTAEAAWHQWQNALHTMQVERATARRERFEAARLNRAAANLIQAEHLRDQALDDRLAADALFKRAHNHEVVANNAEVTIKEGEKAIKDLSNNPALANAINDIKKDIANQTKIRDENRAAAKADVDVARKLLAQASTDEAKAASLERPPVAVVVFKPAPPAKPQPIVAKAPAPAHK